MKPQSLCVFGLSGFATWLFSCLLSSSCWFPFMCVNVWLQGAGVWPPEGTNFSSGEVMFCPVEIWTFKIGNPPVIQGFIVLVLLKSGHLKIPNFDTNPYWSYIERVLKVNSPCSGCGLLLQDALFSWLYFIAALAKRLRWRHAKRLWQQLLVVQTGLVYFRRRATARLRKPRNYGKKTENFIEINCDKWMGYFKVWVCSFYSCGFVSGDPSQSLVKGLTIRLSDI